MGFRPRILEILSPAALPSTDAPVDLKLLHAMHKLLHYDLDDPKLRQLRERPETQRGLRR